MEKVTVHLEFKHQSILECYCPAKVQDFGFKRVKCETVCSLGLQYPLQAQDVISLLLHLGIFPRAVVMEKRTTPRARD